MTAPRVLVISACTGVKAPTEGDALNFADFARGPGYVEERHRGDLAEALRPAEDLYRGQQHLRLMRGVASARSAATLKVDLRILSAGYGLVASHQPLAPYECSFQGMPRTQRREWARRLDIPQAVRAALARDNDVAIVLLGDEYLDVCGLDHDLELGGPTLVFCGSRAALRLPAVERLRPVRLTAVDTRRFRCGLVGLKGEVGGRLLGHLANFPSTARRLSAELLLDALAAAGPVTEHSDAKRLVFL